MKDVEFLAVDGVPIDDELQDAGTVGPELAYLARSYRHSPRALAFRNPSSDWRLFVVLLLYTGWIIPAVWRAAPSARNPNYGVAARGLTVVWGLNTVLVVFFLTLQLVAQ